MTKPQLIVPCLIWWLFLSNTARAYEEPDYLKLATIDGIEFRQYQPYLVAETVVEGEADRDKTANIGFRRLFDYITGDNTVQVELEMTAPVEQRPKTTTEIAMTTPLRQVAASTGWKFSFVVPAKFDESNVPRPTHPDVYVRTIPGELMAVLRFAGRWTDANVNAQEISLMNKLAAAELTTKGETATAFYNAPFSLPFMRRNEVMVAVNSVPVRTAPPPDFDTDLDRRAVPSRGTFTRR